MNETREVRLLLRSGEHAVGFPDARESQSGQLVLLGKSDDGQFAHFGPFSIDDVEAIELIEESESAFVAEPPPRPVTSFDPFTPDDQRV